MFLQNTFLFFRGYENVVIEGYFLERFFNLCMNRGVEVWDINRINDICFECNIFSKDKKVVEEIAHISRCKITKKINKGAISIAKKYKKRKIFAAIFLISIILINMYSARIWQFEIVGNFVIPIEEIKKELEQENVRIGMRKKDLDYDKVKNNIYVRRNDIAWMGFDVKGTKAIIEIVERKNITEDYLKGKPCNVVSNKAGVVQKIIVKSGQKAVNVGDYVNVGDILIYGETSDKFVEAKKIHADGEVVIKKWYTAKSTVPFETDLPNKTGRVHNDYKVSIGNYEINLINSGTNFEKYDTIILENKLKVLNRFELPIKLTKTSYEEICVNTVKYSFEQALMLAKNEVINDLKNQIAFDVNSINDNDFAIFENGDSVSVELTISSLENTGIKVEI